MGNAAMKCFRGRSRTVTVFLLSGETAEFKEPVKASTVMKRFPQHVVLHCSTGVNSSAGGQSRRISVMKPDQPLKRNQNYLITPIKAATNARPFLDSWTFYTLGLSKKLNSKLARKNHRSSRSGSNSVDRRSWIKTVFDKIFRPFPQSYERVDCDDDTVDDDVPIMDTTPLLRINQPSNEPSKQPSVLETRKSFQSLQDWRPSLDRIAESPTLSHNSSYKSSYPSSYLLTLIEAP
ncbi:unnamed protein product [Calypogeia fissa]